MNNPQPVPPIEGHYALLRNSIIALIGPRQNTSEGVFMFHSAHFNYRWFDDGKSYWHDGQYDIIATISPANMQAAANGEIERLRAALTPIDALCPSRDILNTMHPAAITGLILRIGEIASTALKQEEG